MRFDLSGADKPRAYQLLASAVVPRPIALVTTLNEDGSVNAAPFSFFNLVGSDPPALAISIAARGGGSKDSLANIARTGEFVVNLVGEAMAEAMNVCGIDFPPQESELAEAGLTQAPSARVAAPRVAESPAQLECRLFQVVEMGGNRIVLGEVVFLHVGDEFMDSERGRVDAAKMRLIGRMHGGGWYARTSDLFEMPRLSYDEWRSRDE